MILVEVFWGNCLPGGNCAWGSYHMGIFYQWRGGGGEGRLDTNLPQMCGLKLQGNG